MSAPVLWGVDFSSSPSRKKPVVLAHGGWRGAALQLNGFERFSTLAEFGAALRRPEPCVAALDMPFGLPRELVQHLAWPADWFSCMAHYCTLSRADIRLQFKAFCDARPTGSKFAHRACDLPAGSSPSMKWVNPPVAYMLHAGVPLLMASGMALPRLHAGDASRVALEAYPGFLARQVLGRRSYKSDDAAKQTPDRLIARKDLLHALEVGIGSWPRVRLSPALADVAVADASGDHMDALLCLVQVAWAERQHLDGHEAYGLPDCDPLEGWIVGVPLPGAGQSLPAT